VFGSEKGRCRIKVQLPDVSVHKSGKPSLGNGPLARLYANGIFARFFRDVLQRNQRAGTSSMTQPTIRLMVNGRIHEVNAAPDTALLYVLRNDLELNGPNYGCGLGECGACAVLIDGAAARSCVIPISGCVGRDIVTLEGLGSRDHPDPVQEAFIAEQAAQCGYCLNGMIVSTKALLMRNPQPSETEVLEALRYNLCRCGAHIEIMRAAMRAAGAVAEAQD
jgi:nicotinate dehydrogenase subunit A